MAECPELVRHRRSTWKRANKEKVNADTRKRRARIKGSGGEHTASDIQRLLDAQDRTCFYCDTLLNGRFDVDHMVPIARGGHNSPGNLCIACRLCNAEKAARTADEFMRIRLG